MKLVRLTYCTKVGHDGCVNTEGSEHADQGWCHWCPACETTHCIAVEKSFENGARWTFNGDHNVPHFEPSIRIQWGHRGVDKCCHYFIHNGQIEYCADSTHAYAGRTIPLPDIPDGEQ